MRKGTHELPVVAVAGRQAGGELTVRRGRAQDQGVGLLVQGVHAARDRLPLGRGQPDRVVEPQLQP